MLFRSVTAAAALALAGTSLAAPAKREQLVERTSTVHKPKAMVISMFTPERNVWIKRMGHEVDVPFAGASPLVPNVSCDRKGEVCIVTTGEAEINAATTIMALTLAPGFDLTETYFLIAGIAGSGLAYELDSRQIPGNWSAGYWALGTAAPNQLPDVDSLYGTEVFELNTNLLDRAVNLTKDLTLNSSSTADDIVSKWDSVYAAGVAPQASLNGSYYGDDLGTIRTGAAQARRSRRSLMSAKVPSSA
ncbi:hypothetical protein JCM11641_006717 [Rhodosporidiobolus odoratus]